MARVNSVDATAISKLVTPLTNLPVYATFAEVGLPKSANYIPTSNGRLAIDANHRYYHIANGAGVPMVFFWGGGSPMDDDECEVPDWVSPASKSAVRYGAPLASRRSSPEVKPPKSNGFGTWTGKLKNDIHPQGLLDEWRPVEHSEVIGVNKDEGRLTTWSWPPEESGIRLVVESGLAPINGETSEDSPPLTVMRRVDDSVVVVCGVFDGLGGAGASMISYKDPKREEPYEFSQAYIASRLVRSVFEKSALDEDACRRSVTSRYIKNCLSTMSARFSLAENSRVRGTMAKQLPTTIAAFRCDVPLGVAQPTECRVDITWAGDSRVFIISPKFGLSVLTKDDVIPIDALEQLRTDPPMNNVVNNSVNFELRHEELKEIGPFILLAATDGVFGYLPTPGFLEYLFLICLNEPRTKPFAEVFLSRLMKYAADDISFTAVFVGFENALDGAKAEFSRRFRELKERYKVLDRMSAAGEDLDSQIEHLWKIEAPSYNRSVRSA